MHKVLLFIGNFFFLTTISLNTTLYKYFSETSIEILDSSSNKDFYFDTPIFNIFPNSTTGKNNYNSTSEPKNMVQEKYSNTESESSFAFKEPTNSILKNFINWLFILNAVLGLFIAFRISIKHFKKDTNIIYFGIFLTGVSLTLFELAIFWWEGLNYNPKVSFFRAQFYFWIPSLFLYLRNKIENALKLKRLEILVHYSFALVMIGCLIVVNITSSEIALKLINSLDLKAIHTAAYLFLLIYAGVKY